MSAALELTAEQQARREDATAIGIDALVAELLVELKEVQLRYFLETNADLEDAHESEATRLHDAVGALIEALAIWIVDGASPIATLADTALDAWPAKRKLLHALAMRLAVTLSLTITEAEAVWRATPWAPGARS